MADDLILWDGQEEHFVFKTLQLAFNVSLAMQIVGFPYAEPDIDIYPAFIVKDEGVTVHPEKVETANLKHPIILATILDGYRVPIDGMHRLTKAYLNNVITLPAYTLTEKETTRCAIHHKHRLPDSTRLKEIRDIIYQLGLPLMGKPRK